jgi:hypothetical protein
MPTWIGVFSGVSTFFRTTTGKDKFGLSNNVDDKDSWHREDRHELVPAAAFGRYSWNDLGIVESGHNFIESSGPLPESEPPKKSVWV